MWTGYVPRALARTPNEGVRGLAGAAMPVFSGALDRSIALAAAMDSRGYGRTGDSNPRERRITAGLVLLGLIGTCLGLYALLDSSAVSRAGLPLLVLGLVAAAVGLVRGGRRNRRSRYRPDPWAWPGGSLPAAGRWPRPRRSRRRPSIRWP